MGLVDKAIDAMTNYTETKEKIKDFSSAGINTIQGTYERLCRST